MAQSDLKIVGSAGQRPRMLLGACALIAIVLGSVAVRRQFGDMIAELTTNGDPSSVELADLAHGMAPGDPLVMWLKATLEKNVFSPERTESSVRMFEETVRLSPRDYRWWIELGRAYEQAERPEQAENAFKRSIELAPTYTFPRWQLGNFYLRQGQSDLAFAELKRVTENNETYRDQVFSLAWEYFDKDPVQLEQVVADKPEVHAALATFYAQRGRAADSLRNWNLLSEDQKDKYPLIAKAIMQGLLDRRFFPQALEFARQLDIDPDARPEAVTNAGFEKPLGNADITKFGWRTSRNDSKIEVAVDAAVHHDGAKSARITFKRYIKPDLYTLGQNIVVEPERSYKLSFWVRTENLHSAGMPQLQVVNGNDDQLITNSPAFVSGTNDWRQIVIEIRTPANCTGLVIYTSRASCGGEGCPISGTMWYDEFELKRLN
jgi:tetratricopeptide (TPR) repeat protein